MLSRLCSTPHLRARCLFPSPPVCNTTQRSGATVTGLNNNEYQISRGKVLNRRHRALEACGFIKADFMSIPVLNRRHRALEACGFIKADFMSIPVPDASFDAVYAIEATCHAPDAVGCYSEVKRVLKPGQCFAAYEWCLTDAYDPNNPQHQEVKREVELGNGLPDIRTTAQVRQALLDAGFEQCGTGNGLPDIRTTAQVRQALLDAGFESIYRVYSTAVSSIPCHGLPAGHPHHGAGPPGAAGRRIRAPGGSGSDGDSGGGVTYSAPSVPVPCTSHQPSLLPSSSPSAQLLEAADLTETAEVAWHKPLDPSYFSLSQFKLTRVGRFLTTTLVRALSHFLSPPPSYASSKSNHSVIPCFDMHHPTICAVHATT
ncbi:unnamed protein product [Closterium sp. Naga37s-1]|nr:unnamed protein product [Closterium sp. Naga37s-1]